MTYTSGGTKFSNKYIINYTMIPEDSSANRNTERLDPIQRFDLSITKHLRLLSSNWEIGISVFNLFNRKNISHTKYVSDLEKNISSTNVYMLGMTPTIHIRLTL